MRVVLREDIDKLGRRGEVREVAAGYARNFLLPKGKALTATGILMPLGSKKPPLGKCALSQ